MYHGKPCWFELSTARGALSDADTFYQKVFGWSVADAGMADFTYHLMPWFMPVSESGAGMGSLKGHQNDPGIPAIETYIEEYCRLTGRQAIANLDIYMAYNFFRIAAILQGILGRVRDGTAASHAAAAMAAQVKPLAETAWGFARSAGA